MTCRSYRLTRRTLLAGGSLAALAGCAGRRDDGSVLRLAGTQQGERLRPAFEAAIDSFQRARPGVRVERIEMDDEVYQQMGLVTMFVGGTPPDLYFQWGGYQVRRYARAGHALDLTPAFPPRERLRYLPTSWAGATGDDGRIYLWPDSASVTTVLWYRRSHFRRLRLPLPASWQDLLDVCARLRAEGIVPIAVGNRELWPGGNFAAYVTAQHAGTARYNAVLRLDPGTRLDDPAFVEALGFVGELRRRGFLNEGVNGVGTDDARSLLAQGKAAIHPIGDWLVSEAAEDAVADLDAFRLPRLPGQQGHVSTLLALPTGYMVNRTTRHPELAVQLLRHLTSDEVQREWVRRGHVSAVRAAAPGSGAPAGQRRVLRFLEEARETALAPDVGFHLEVSDAFLDAVSLVLGGEAGAAEALAEAERQVRALRRRS